MLILLIVFIQVIDVYSLVHIEISFEVACDCLAYDIIIMKVVVILLVEIRIVKHAAAMMAGNCHALRLVNHQVINVLWILSFNEVA
jgi:hypothetical protein